MFLYFTGMWQVSEVNFYLSVFNNIKSDLLSDIDYI